jgi:hypothetical protein
MNKIAGFHLAYVIACHTVTKSQNLYNRRRKRNIGRTFGTFDILKGWSIKIKCARKCIHSIDCTLSIFLKQQYPRLLSMEDNDWSYWKCAAFRTHQFASRCLLIFYDSSVQEICVSWGNIGDNKDLNKKLLISHTESFWGGNDHSNLCFSIIQGLSEISVWITRSCSGRRSPIVSCTPWVYNCSPT